MFRSIVAAVGLLMILVAPVAADEAPPSSDKRIAVVRGPDLDNPRLPLAQRLVELSMAGMDKVLQGVIEQGFESSNLPDEQKHWLRRNMGPMFEAHLRPLIAATVQAYADRLTEAELNAMITFYDSPAGRSIARKQLELSVETGPEMARFEAAFLTELMTKFCGEFDCEGQENKGTRSAKPSRR